MKLSACAMLALLMATPVLADPPGDFAGDVRMSNDNGSALDNGSSSSESPQGKQQPGACVRLLERAFYLADPASPDRAFDARHEMELARSAFHAGNEFDCKRHAIHALDDRS